MSGALLNTSSNGTLVIHHPRGPEDDRDPRAAPRAIWELWQPPLCGRLVVSLSAASLAPAVMTFWDEVLPACRAAQAKRDPAIGPSDVDVLHGGCLRRLAYRTQGYGTSDPVPEHIERAAFLGDAIHAAVASARRATGWDLVEAEVQVPGFPRPGRLDGYTAGRVDDVKTVSDRVFEQVVLAGKARPQDQDQPTLYGLAVLHGGLRVDVLSITYVRRSDGEPFEDSWSYDPAYAVHTNRRMLGIIRGVAESRPEDFGRAARTPQDRPCDGCPFRSRCWGRDLAPEPQAPLRAAELPDLLARYHELAERRREIEREMEGLRPYAEHAAGTTFTDHEGILRRVRLSAGRAPGDGGAMDRRAARALLEYWGESVPTLGVAPRLSMPAVTRRDQG